MQYEVVCRKSGFQLTGASSAIVSTLKFGHLLEIWFEE